MEMGYTLQVDKGTFYQVWCPSSNISDFFFIITQSSETLFGGLLFMSFRPSLWTRKHKNYYFCMVLVLLLLGRCNWLALELAAKPGSFKTMRKSKGFDFRLIWFRHTYNFGRWGYCFQDYNTLVHTSNSVQA